MKKTSIAALVIIPTVLFSGCTVRDSAYYPRSNYVYSTGYYGYKPYMGNYYTGGWGNVGYWRGYRANRGYGWGNGFGWNRGFGLGNGYRSRFWR